VQHRMIDRSIACCLCCCCCRARPTLCPHSTPQKSNPPSRGPGKHAAAVHSSIDRSIPLTPSELRHRLAACRWVSSSLPRLSNRSFQEGLLPSSVLCRTNVPLPASGLRPPYGHLRASCTSGSLPMATPPGRRTSLEGPRRAHGAVGARRRWRRWRHPLQWLGRRTRSEARRQGERADPKKSVRQRRRRCRRTQEGSRLSSERSFRPTA
jgi:hypothetical protein